ncbi:MAG: hypothetical protein HDS75_04795 [Bacteroidales bacterium]|nr:hypothetical protein [Bacteroidales bacterium]MDE6802821.1 hypothetical protein [Muribaculaceae bacterium]
MKILYCENPIWTPGEPTDVSLLVDSSLSRNFHPLFLPPHSSEWRLTTGIAIRIVRLGKFISARFAHRYYDAATLIARLRPANLRLPATATMTAFDSSAVVGEWMPLGDGAPEAITIGGDADLTLPFDREAVDNLVEHLSQYFMLKTGDIIVAGDIDGFIRTPQIDTSLRLTLNGSECLNFKIK